MEGAPNKKQKKHKTLWQFLFAIFLLLFLWIVGKGMIYIFGFFKA